MLEDCRACAEIPWRGVSPLARLPVCQLSLFALRQTETVTSVLAALSLASELARLAPPLPNPYQTVTLHARLCRLDGKT